ncbi:MAG: helix-turn-helix domain-containing protein [Finegoldia magna]|uniref:helix-turn-helix domain-containing protein n=1 Tax=Finegoldia magna TaxID=1260 RepID=UPI00399F047B
MRNSKEIINIIKQKREQLDISQRELAKLTGLNNSTISRYENLQRDFPINDLPIFCKVLDLDLNEVLNIEPKKENKLTTDQEQLITHYNNSNTQGKTIILTTAKNISKAYPIVTREEMLSYLKQFQRAAYGDMKSIYDMTDEELEQLYIKYKEDFEDD